MQICPQCHTKTTERICPDDGYQTVLYRPRDDEDGDPLLGQVFQDRYAIDGLLGRGGFGAVYSATQLAIGRRVAIKVLRADLTSDLKEVARFQQEARAIAALKHPNIVEIYDFGQADDGNLYLVMDFLEGEPLSSVIAREGGLPSARVVHIGLQALDALAEAHAGGVIHRDLKPENLFIAREGRRSDVVKLLDFGIAKVSGDAAADMTLTKAGLAIGSLKVMSPEQCRGRQVTPQSDIYSFGCVLFQLLFGTHVFTSDNDTGYLLAHSSEEPRLPVREGKVPVGPLVDLTLECLAKDPEARPAGAEAVAKRLEAAGATGIQWVPTGDGATMTLRKTSDGTRALPTDDPVLTGLARPRPDAPERRSTWWWAGAALFLLGGGLAAWLVTQSGPTSGAPSEVAELSPPPAERAESSPVAAPPIAEPSPPPEDDSAAPSAPQVDAAPVIPSDEASGGGEDDSAPTPPPESPTEVAPPKTWTVTVASEPSGAWVFHGTERLGRAPQAVSWTEGEEPPTVRVARRGYVSSTRRLSTDDGVLTTVRLKKTRTAVTPKPAAPAPAKFEAGEEPPPQPQPEKF